MRLLYSLIALLLIAPAALAQTMVTANIAANTDWTASGSPYIVTKTIRVLDGVTLTVASGVEVRFALNASLIVGGVLNAGAATFTSDAAAPTAGDWRGISVQGQTTLDGATIRYASNSLFAQETSTVTLLATTVELYKFNGISVFDGATARLKGVTVQEPGDAGNAAYSGLSLISPGGNEQVWEGPAVRIADLTVRGAFYAIRLGNPAPLVLEGTHTLEGNMHNAIAVLYDGHRGSFTFAPGIPYHFLDSGRRYQVASTDSTTILPGAVLKFWPGFQAELGHVTAVGAPDAPIVFTALTDDTAGGDSNGDGATTAPSVGYWNLVSGEGVFRHLRVRYAASGLQAFGTSTVTDSEFRANRYGLSLHSRDFLSSSDAEARVRTAPGFATATRNTFGEHQDAPIRSDINVRGDVTGNTFQPAAKFAGVGFSYDGTGRTFAGRFFTRADTLHDLGLPYVLLNSNQTPDGSLHVGRGASLRIEPGVVLKSDGPGVRVTGSGRLDVVGAEDAPVVFTSLKDDVYAGDTNLDGNTTVPAVTNWRGVTYQGSGTAGSVAHAVFRYGNDNYVSFGSPAQTYYEGAVLTLAGADVNVTDSEFRNVRVGITLLGNVAPTISGSTFGGVEDAPVALSFASNPTFTDNTLDGAGTRALGIVGETLRFDGTLAPRSFAGLDNITYMLLGSVTVAETVRLTVEPGIVVKALPNTGLFVDGGLKLEGTAEQPIVFTSADDDRVGNPADTRSDGSDEVPEAGDWLTIHYRSTALRPFSSVAHFESHFARIGLIVTGGDVPVSNALITRAHYTGLALDEDNASAVSGVRIEESDGTPLLLSMRADPAFSGASAVTFRANRDEGVGLVEALPKSKNTLEFNALSDNTLRHDAVVEPRTLDGRAAVPYVWVSATVARGTKLTVRPGVRIKFINSAGGLTVDGVLAMEGTAADPVVITDLEDDAVGGDTNLDGNDSAPRRGGFSFRFRANERDDENVIRHTRIAYGGYSGGTNSVVQFEDASGLLEDVTIEQANTNAVRVLGSADPTLRRVRMLNLDGFPVTMAPFSNPTFEDNDALNVAGIALWLESDEVEVDATFPQRSFLGYDNIAYVLDCNSRITVRSGATLTIPAGTVFKAAGRFRCGGSGFTVEGRLDVQGTDDAPVVFTHIDDDRAGSPLDTQDNGAEGAYQGGVLAYRTSNPIRFTDRSNDASTLSGLHLFYAGTGIELQSASPTITGSLFDQMETGIAMTNGAPTVSDTRFERMRVGLDLNEVSAPTITGNTFADLGGFYDYHSGLPIRMSLASDFTASGNVIEGDTWQAIGVRDETLVRDVTLLNRTFAGRAGIPYVFGRYTVANNAVLTLDPGVVAKFSDGGHLIVRRGLIAQGAEGAGGEVVFTHVSDDFYGGDTNRDSTATAPTPGEWTGLIFENEALDPSLRLARVVVRFAQTGLEARSASPTIANASFQRNQRGLLATGSAAPTVTDSDFSGHTEYAVGNTGSAQVTATGNWWGNDSGPTAPGNAGGTGDAVVGNVAFLPFVGTTLNPALGDVSLNGVVQAFDAGLLLGHLVSPSLSARQLALADVSGEGGASALDASLILQLMVGLIDAFPVESSGKTDALALYRDPSVELDVAQPIAAVGETVDVAVRLSGASGQVVVASRVALLGDGVTILGVAPGELAKDAATDAAHDASGATFALARTTPLQGDGTLAVVTVRLDRPDGRLTITEFIANETDLTSTVTAGEQAALPDQPTLTVEGANPTRGATTIGYALPAPAHVQIEVYDALGRRVALLADRDAAARTGRVVWDAGRVTPGVYFVRMTSEAATLVRTVVVAR